MPGLYKSLTLFQQKVSLPRASKAKGKTPKVLEESEDEVYTPRMSKSRARKVVEESESEFDNDPLVFNAEDEDDD